MALPVIAGMRKVQTAQVSACPPFCFLLSRPVGPGLSPRPLPVSPAAWRGRRCRPGAWRRAAWRPCPCTPGRRRDGRCTASPWCGPSPVARRRKDDRGRWGLGCFPCPKSITIRRIRQQIWGRIFVNFLAYLCTFPSFPIGLVGKGHIKNIEIEICTPLRPRERA